MRIVSSPAIAGLLVLFSGCSFDSLQDDLSETSLEDSINEPPNGRVFGGPSHDDLFAPFQGEWHFESRVFDPKPEHTATAAAYAEKKLSAKVESVAAVPTADGHFDTKVAVEVGDDAAAIMPGMTCQLTLTAHNKPDAITIPLSALVSDETTGKNYVYRVGSDGSHAKTEITLGARGDDKVEVVQGLLEGDTILLEKP